jgi:nucleotide-binding universal stress UspA family protein
VDGRLGDRDAIVLAGQLAAPGASLTLAHVYTGAYLPSFAITPTLEKEARGAAEQHLESARASADVDAKPVLVEAPTVGQGLHDQAEAATADLLVVGSSHRGPFGRAMLGDDTHAALDGTPCAIAVAPKAYAERVAPLATIGVGYDESPESTAALEVAKRLAERTHARVRVLQVVTVPSFAYTGAIGPLVEDVDEMVKQAEARLRTLPGVEPVALFGLPGEELAAFSGEVDLLIVGSRRYGPLHRLIAGSTARHLERHARSPLLILPRGTAYAKSAAGVGGASPPNDRA